MRVNHLTLEIVGLVTGRQIATTEIQVLVVKPIGSCKGNALWCFEPAESDKVGDVRFEAGVGADVYQISRVKGVLAAELVGLAEDTVQLVAVVKRPGVLEADISARATFDTVVARELITLEKIGRIEHEALRIFVRKRAGKPFVRSCIDLDDRFEQV